MSPLGSVVIPAHNEEERIAETLRVLTAGAPPGTFEVVVVCNGCTDATAARARANPAVEVVEIPEASKVAALRAGDERASQFPRIYLDADVGLPGPAALALLRALDGDDARVAGLVADIDVDGSSRGVRRFYRFRQLLPVFQHGIIGAGVYALNQSGHARVGTWPEVIGDDQYVLRLFSPQERVFVSGHRSQVAAPRDLGSLVRRGIRVRRGNRELTAGAAGHALESPPTGVSAALKSCLRHPTAWPAAATWLVVTAWIRILTRLRPDGGDWSGPERLPAHAPAGD